MRKFKQRIRNFFFPPVSATHWVKILPYVVLGVLTLVVVIGSSYGWEYTNSDTFCGPTCHTMPPQYATYIKSPHANVTCSECHIGRAFIASQILRKAQDVREIVAMTFATYEYPIFATRLRPAIETCEKCHLPEKFSNDSLVVNAHYASDQENSEESTYLILKTGGGTAREGLGLGIHWHISNKVEYYSTDELSQTIPYIRVHNDDGTITEYTDFESGFNPASLDESELKQIDCVTCHNRVSHQFLSPTQAMDSYLQRGLIEATIPEIHTKGVEVLSVKYSTYEDANDAIGSLETFYKDTYPNEFSENGEAISEAISKIQEIYTENVFLDQKTDWETHPDNLGHIDSPGCFRCHDGKHLNDNLEAIRLECNLCHSIPIVADQQDFVTNIEISRSPEPESHLNSNWINLHRKFYDFTCENCHTISDAGGTSNTSFCSNSACHGSVYTYAGFDAPGLHEILKSQFPTPAPVITPAPVVGNPTYDANIQALFIERCTVCHKSENPTAGLDLSTYTGTMKGGKEPVIILNNSAASKLVQVQSKKHFANLSPEGLNLIIEWINSGAHEK